MRNYRLSTEHILEINKTLGSLDKEWDRKGHTAKFDSLRADASRLIRKQREALDAMERHISV